MKQTAIPLVSGFAITLLVAITLWHLLVAVLLVRAMAGVLDVLGRLI